MPHLNLQMILHHSLYHTYIKFNDNIKIEIETQDQGEGKYKYATLTE